MILRSTLVADPSETPADATRAESGEQLVRARGGAHAPALPGRYVDLGAVARGSFGEVRRVRDVVLDRVLAMKVLHAELSARPWIRRRFFTEVQITAQLQHPGIVPVYDHGELPDGRLWYAMKEVRGRTLGAILREIFEASSAEGFGATPSGWTFRRVVDVFARVAQTVAHAHRQGVFHRDLKPENVMIGELGEVMVMDWGLARRVAPAAREAEDDGPDEAAGDASARRNKPRARRRMPTAQHDPPQAPQTPRDLAASGGGACAHAPRRRARDARVHAARAGARRARPARARRATSTRSGRCSTTCSRGARHTTGKRSSRCSARSGAVHRRSIAAPRATAPPVPAELARAASTPCAAR
jgi:serine/threonine protein kinase